MSKLDSKVKSRFFAKVERTPGCWIWIGAKRGSRGYGVFTMCGVGYAAHRIAYAIEHPEHEEAMLTKRRAEGMRGDYVLHSCDNPSCVNPAHLRLGLTMDNSRDMVLRGRGCAGLPPTPKGGKRGSGAQRENGKTPIPGPVSLAVEHLLNAASPDPAPR